MRCSISEDVLLYKHNILCFVSHIVKHALNIVMQMHDGGVMEGYGCIRMRDGCIRIFTDVDKCIRMQLHTNGNG